MKTTQTSQPIFKATVTDVIGSYEILIPARSIEEATQQCVALNPHKTYQTITVEEAA